MSTEPSTEASKGCAGTEPSTEGRPDRSWVRGIRRQVRVHQVDTVMRMELENLKLAVEKGKKAAKKGRPANY